MDAPHSGRIGPDLLLVALGGRSHRGNAVRNLTRRRPDGQHRVAGNSLGLEGAGTGPGHRGYRVLEKKILGVALRLAPGVQHVVVTRSASASYDPLGIGPTFAATVSSDSNGGGAP